MRLHILACIAVRLAICAIPANAFEIEQEQVFPGDDATDELRILSTTDLSVFKPVIEAFQAENPGVGIHYVVTSSSELFRAIHVEGAAFDLAISSAMDLQLKIANDGLASAYSSDHTANLPDWAKWRGEVFAFTREPAVLIASKSAFAEMPIPRNRSELIEYLRKFPDKFYGKIGTYDVRLSGLGYLFATQDSRHSEIYWPLIETFGRLGARLYCCSADMIADVESGRLALAYNVLGSYARQELNPENSSALLVEFEDFSTAMLRTALIPKSARNIRMAGRMIDFLISLDDRPGLREQTGFPTIPGKRDDDGHSANQIRLGVGLLVYLDDRKKEIFMEAWINSIQSGHTSPHAPPEQD